MTDRENKWSKIVFSLAYFVCALIFACGKINGISPFSSAFLYASQVLGIRPILSAISFIVGEIITGVSVKSVAFSILGAFPLFLTVLIKNKKSMRRASVLSCCAFHLITRFFTHLYIDLVYLGINAVLTVCFSAVFYMVLSQISSFYTKTKLTDSESACILTFIMALSVGLAPISLFNQSVLYIVAGFFCVATVWSVGRGVGVLCALAIGSGYAFYYFDPTLMGLFAFCSLCASMFVSSKRIFAFLASFMAFTVFDLYFMGVTNGFAIKLCFFIAGATVFLIIPKRWAKSIRDAILANDGNIAVRYLVNRNRYETARRIANLKEVFQNESEILFTLKTDNKHAVVRLAQKIEEQVCYSCANYEHCKRKGLSSALTALSRHTIIKNKSEVSPIPSLLENECISLATLVGCAHNKSLEIRRDLIEINTQNKIKESLANTLKGVRDILEREEICVGCAIGFDFDREEKIKDELAINGVVCSQVLVVLGTDFEITLLVKRETYNKELIEKAISIVLGVGVKIIRKNDSVIKGWLVVDLIQKPNFGAMVGVSCQSKVEGANGDAHSFVKLREGKYLCALCDGMGSGEKASALADRAVTLIENFYRAGFEHSITIKSVNDFLKVDCDDGFSALDIMVFDAYEGRVDVIKLASPPCYVKKRNHTVRIDSSSLPLGIVGEIAPCITSRKVESGDCFVFVSDGISDCFSGDELSAFINNSDARNPQLLADTILEESKQRNAYGKKDDMTVITLSVFDERI